MTLLHFAHANGFPAQTYQHLFEFLPQHWTVLAKSQFGHDPKYPVNSNWQHQAKELAAFLDTEAGSEKVWLVGHSFGAVISYILACQQPNRVLGLIMLDPPIIYGPKRHLIRLAKPAKMMDRITPAKLAANRRSQWPPEENMHTYFAKKALFKNIQPRCIEDYVKYGVSHQSDGQYLRFSANVEADIFRNLPHDLPSYRGKLRCPAKMITGDESRVTPAADRNRFVRENGMALQWMPGGHMFPLEHPDRVATEIIDTIHHWQQS